MSRPKTLKYPKRWAVSFRPDPDIKRLLESAHARGLPIRAVCNAALRRHLPAMLAGLVRELDGPPKTKAPGGRAGRSPSAGES